MGRAAAGNDRIVFVETADRAPAPRADSTVVSLDTSWTPAPGERPDLMSARPLLGAVIERVDMFDHALDLVDAWAAATGIADRLAVDGVTYWFRLRETMWRWLHERLLWRAVIEALDPSHAAANVVVPSDEIALGDVASLTWPGRVTSEPASAPPSRTPRGFPGRVPGGVRLGRLFGRARAAIAPNAEQAERARRDSVLARRVSEIVAGPAPRVIVLTNPATYQRVGADGGSPADPLFGSVIPRLRQSGITPVLFGTHLNHHRDEQWAPVEAEPSLLPQSLLRARWSTDDDDPRADQAVAAIATALAALRGVSLDADGLDLGPAFIDALEAAAIRIVRSDVQMLARITRLIGEIAPRAILLAQEGIRTPWLIAGGRTGVPVFAVQHGILYPRHPGYAPIRHPRLVLPQRTFVYGDAEREMLVNRGVYRPDEVEVSGSPRLDLDKTPIDAAAANSERAQIRRELGVADGDRLLVVSTVNLRFVQRSHFVHVLAQVLGGPLPHVHVAFKQHPGEFDAGPYRQLLEGLARAGGYQAPPISIVKDVDLYRLLRAADAHLGVLSTVLTEAVIVGRPNLIALVDRHADLLDYVAAGVARPVRSPEDLRAELGDLRPPDARARKAFLDRHYRSGDATGRIVAAVQQVVGSTADAA
jgi:hypothetical protein